MALGVIYHHGEGQLQPLEIQRGIREEVSRMAPLQRSTLFIPGLKSPVRFASGQTLRFQIRYRLDSPTWGWPAFQLDPSAFSLYSLRCQGDRRTLTLQETTPIRTVHYPGRPFLVTPKGQDCLELTLASPLEPGEYAIRYGKDLDACDLFCFGLDV